MFCFFHIFSMDGKKFASNTVYNKIPGTNYVAGYIKLADGTHTVRHSSPISIFGGFLFGRAKFEAYGFPTGLRLAPINTVRMRSIAYRLVLCLGRTITF